MRYQLQFILLFTIFVTLACENHKTSETKSVIAIPVYGQSLALGEEAMRITNFDTFRKYSNHRVLTENLDEAFGYLSDTHFKQWLKKFVNDRRRSFELSIYGMSEVLSDFLAEKGGEDSLLICTFPGGQGATGITDLGRGSAAYQKFLDEIETAYKKAHKKGWKFSVPAFCWMQGENDVVWRTSTNYRNDLKTFHTELNEDIKLITGQTNDIICISYQTNCLTLAEQFDSTRFDCYETSIPQGQMELVRDDSLFMASGPTYPYSFVDERVHIDGISQKRLGYLAGLSVIRSLESKPSKGLTPADFYIVDDTVVVSFNVSAPPLVFDTLAVNKAVNYGFSVIDTTNRNILQYVTLKDNTVKLHCISNPLGSKIRYAVNGTLGKNGHEHGPRGNLRDSQGENLTANILNKQYPLHNWCYQFDVLVN